ncbi:MAG: signal peptidase I [Bacteroidales bacterium]|nr:signal peptidase I [Bacteroidales bacterium]
MKIALKNWFLPVSLAIVLVILLKVFFISKVVMKDDSMQQSIFKGETVFYTKQPASKRNSIVVFRTEKEDDNLFLKRQVGLPGDTIEISNSIIYINGQRLNEQEGVSFTYSFETDSINSVSNYLISNKILFNIRAAYLGYFTCNTDMNGLKILNANPYIKNIRRAVVESFVKQSSSIIMATEFYWNKDNLGPVIIPRKGTYINLGQKSFFLYKEIIEKESRKKLVHKNNIFYLGKQEIKEYTFQMNYYFLLNDNRTNYSDSRWFGFVADNQIIGTYLFAI